MARLFLLAFLIIQFNITNAQVSTQTTIGSPTDDKVGSIVPLSTGEFLLAGYTANGIASSRDILLIKLDAFGDTIWVKTYGTSNNEMAIKCTETKKGHYLVTGEINDRILLLKTDTNGSVLLQRGISHDNGANSDFGYDIAEASNGDIYICGRTIYTRGNSSAYVVKTDSTGTIIWHWAYGIGRDYAFGLAVDSKDGIIVVGQGTYTRNPQLNGTNGLIAKLESSKKLSWSRVYGSNSSDNLFEVITLSDGSHIAVGHYGASGGRDAMMIKLNSSGNIVWRKTYGGSSRESFIDVKETSDGGFIAVGTTESFGAGGQDIYAVRTKSNGDTIWTRTYGGAGEDGGNGQWLSVCEAPNGGFAIASYAQSFNSDSNDVFIIRLDSNGHSSNCNEYHTQTSVSTPTLMNGFMVLFYTLNASRGVSLTASMTRQDSSFNIRNLTPAIRVNNDTAICIGDTALLIVQSKHPYQWSNGLGSTDSILVHPSASTTYSVVATDTNLCTSTAKINVEVRALPVVTITGNDKICKGDTAALMANGALTYSWDNGWRSGAQISIRPPVTTRYSVSGTDTNGCVNDTNVLVTVNELPVIKVSDPDSICLGDTAVITASGAKNYVWSPGAIPGASVMVFPSVSATYSVVGTDSNSCSNTAQAKVVVHPLPNVGVSGPRAVCKGDSAAFMVTGASTYTWSPGNLMGPEVKVPINRDTTFTVVGTDQNNCKNSDQITVTVKPLPDVLVTRSRNLLTAQNGNAGVNYQWVDCEQNFAVLAGDTMQAFKAGVNGSYAVIIEENGCLDTSACIDVTGIGINRNDFGNNLLVYPNPTKGMLSIWLKGNQSTVQATVMDLQGKVVTTREFEGPKLELNLEGAPGVYLIRIVSRDQLGVFRIVVE